MKFFFNPLGDVVVLRARLDDGERIGDARAEIADGQKFYNISYDELRKVGSGVVEVDEDGVATFVSAGEKIR